MASSVRTSGGSGGRSRRGAVRGGFAWAWLALLLPIASCVPAVALPGAEVRIALGEPAYAAAPAAAAGEQTGVLPSLEAAGPGYSLAGATAFAANFNLPVAGGPNPAASAFALRGSAPLDQMRALDCLTQAVYYEAGNQSEDGQRAVAQVVINRVRHPSWPNSVCGVVYQGPMRAGGGCQFTFTCDGSLARTPMPVLWAQARRIAAEALAGRTFAPVGMSTFYHANYVFPAWAPRLVKTAVIGAHNFYRLPGLAGAPGAFSDAYAGAEPIARGSSYMARSSAGAGAIPAVATAQTWAASGAAATGSAAPIPSDIPQDARWTPNNLPASTIREEYRQSGQWRTDAPGAVR
jgi:spore germination cell wall hydrolase CwlJ-like protein